MSLDFLSLFGDADLDYKCPECNSDIAFKLSEVGSTIVCPNCSVQIQLNPSEDYDESVESVNESLSELEDTFKNFGK